LRGALFATKQSRENDKLKIVIYAGVTNNLKKRIYEHREKQLPGFSERYNLSKLVYYEIFNTISDAIVREKQIKGGSRKKKFELRNKFNPTFEDLYEII